MLLKKKVTNIQREKNRMNLAILVEIKCEHMLFHTQKENDKEM